MCDSECVLALVRAFARVMWVRESMGVIDYLFIKPNKTNHLLFIQTPRVPSSLSSDKVGFRKDMDFNADPVYDRNAFVHSLARALQIVNHIYKHACCMFYVQLSPVYYFLHEKYFQVDVLRPKRAIKSCFNIIKTLSFPLSCY